MKAIILERRGELAAVLCEDGTFANRRVSGEIGETVELAAETVAFPTKKRSRWARSAVAAALALAVTGGTLGYMSGTASAYVSLDVEDSSIELTVNHFGRVIAVNAVSEDAKELAASLSGEVRNRRVEDALDHTMKRLSDDGYFKEDSTAVVAGIATDNEKRAAELRQFVEHSAERVGEKPAYVSESSRAEREQAKEQHVSVGRFGFERDHGELPKTSENALEPKDGTAERTESAVPASGAESGVTDAPQAQGTEQPTQNIPRQAATGGQPGQPAPEQGQPPRGEEPDDDHEQPPRDEEPDDDHEQPPHGEEPDDDHGQPPRDEEPDDDHEQPPRDEEPDDDHEQPPRGEEPDDDHGQPQRDEEPDDDHEQPPRDEEPDDDLDQPPQVGDREDDHGQPPQGGERP